MPPEGSELTHICMPTMILPLLGLGALLNLLFCFFAVCKSNSIKAKNMKKARETEARVKAFYAD